VETDVLKANEGLTARIDELSSQVAKQQRMLELCFEVITNFGHFVPSIIRDFEDELEQINGEDLCQ
tara:strand:+ start:4629 stop:4826 length:198 start_codon:yes stop_codon:yes gene_type:complete